MIILGLSENVHDASACIIKNGKILSAIATERITGKKKDADLPDSLIYLILLQSGIKIEDVDCVVCATCGHDNKDYIGFDCDETRLNSRIFTMPGNINITGYYIPHHIAHAASAYYTSSFNESVTFSVDCCSFNGMTGKLLNSLYCHFEGNKLKKVYHPECFDGARYAKVTEYTGFSPCLERVEL